MKKNFYDLNKIKDKKDSSSTHKSQYLNSVENFNIPFKKIENIKSKFINNKDQKIISVIIHSLKTQNKFPFTLTPQESFYLDNINEEELFEVIKTKPNRRLLSIYRFHLKLYSLSNSKRIEKKIIEHFCFGVL